MTEKEMQEHACKELLKKVAAGLHTMLCKPIKGCFVPGWLGYYMNSETYHKQLAPYIAGVKVMSISKGNIVKTHILMPPIEEQTAIVPFPPK